MAYFLGCDVSSRKLDFSLINGTGKQLWTDQIVNAEQDIAQFLLTVSGDSPGFTLVAEATGIYHLPLVNTAYALGIQCVMYNPLLTKQQIKATVRGKKTDKTDALMIARLGLRSEGRPYIPESYLATKYYARGQQRLAQLDVAFKHYQDHVETLLEGQMSNEAKQALTDTERACILLLAPTSVAGYNAGGMEDDHVNGLGAAFTAASLSKVYRFRSFR